MLSGRKYTTKKRTEMYTIYYYNQGCYHQQRSCRTLKEAKASYNEEREGHIKNGNGKIMKRYTGRN